MASVDAFMDLVVSDLVVRAHLYWGAHELAGLEW